VRKIIVGAEVSMDGVMQAPQTTPTYKFSPSRRSQT
jgi:hypothetical protein